MSVRSRREVGEVDFDPQTHRQEPGRKGRPALIIQCGALNQARHPTTIVIPGTSQVDSLPPENNYPLPVRIQKTGELRFDTDLLIDQVRAISNSRFQIRLCAAPPNILKQAENALRILIGR